MIATVDIADLGRVGTLRALLRRPKVGAVPGLRWAEAATLLPLASGAKPPSLRRAALLAFWDDEAAAEAFARTHPLAARFADGFHARLRPLRAFGSWPGLDADIPRERSVHHDGPVMVLTLARLRPTQLVRFMRASAPAEQSAVDSDGMLWGTASTRPPFMATISAWESGAAAATYAYGRGRPQHADAVGEQQRKDFHRESAFIRFAPLHVEGGLGGPNPLDPAALSRT